MDNRQAIGYMLLASKNAGLDKEATKKLFDEMYHLFDIYMEDEAKDKGFKWYHSLSEDE